MQMLPPVIAGVGGGGSGVGGLVQALPPLFIPFESSQCITGSVRSTFCNVSGGVITGT